MKSQTLYRKYRPQTFADVIGQDHVVSVLLKAIAKKQPAHAYLFSGGRGIGKTSIARILARELGVHEDDLYEIDAASHTGVDDIRALREGATTLPLRSPYKVYILDEVHMLSKGAFNALLKILEEPPAHVLFMLATTDMHKVPDTILSRCEVYTLHRPSRAVLSETLKKIVIAEGHAIEPGAADLIALIGDGSFRDTLSVLQQVLTGITGKKVTEQTVQSVTGAPTHTTVRALIDAWAKKDTAEALKTISGARADGAHIGILFTRVLDAVRAILLLRFAPTMRPALEEQYAPEDIEYFVSLADHTTECGKAITSKLLRALLEVGKDISRSDAPHVLLELLTFDLTEHV
jgi:DNA polymerase III subunit gamma/tau